MFEYFKERRRAALFFTTLLAFPGVLALGALLHVLVGNNEIPEEWPVILPAIGMVLLGLFWRWARQRRRMRHWGRYQSSPLSQDERVKARRKLATKPEARRR